MTSSTENLENLYEDDVNEESRNFFKDLATFYYMNGFNINKNLNNIPSFIDSKADNSALKLLDYLQRAKLAVMGMSSDDKSGLDDLERFLEYWSLNYENENKIENLEKSLLEKIKEIENL